MSMTNKFLSHPTADIQTIWNFFYESFSFNLFFFKLVFMNIILETIAGHLYSTFSVDAVSKLFVKQSKSLYSDQSKKLITQ